MPRVQLSSCILATFLPAGLVVGAALAGSTASSHPAKRDLRSITNRTPLLFEKNQGQTDARASFLARGDGYTVFVTPSEAVLKLKNRATKRHSPFVKPGHEWEQAAQSPTSVLRMELVAANKKATVTGVDPSTSRVSYFRGNNQHAQADAATFGKARCENVYPGVDLVYYGNQRQLEYDFIVAPGADPDQIRFRMGGARNVSVDDEGHLAIKLEDGELQLQKPQVYQQTAGRKRVVDSSYRLAANGDVSFQLGDYDPAQPLVIDPVIVYSTLLGGSGFDSGSAVAISPDGSVYVAGYTESVNFPVSGGQAAGGGDAFVTKFSPDGSQVVFSAYLGGSGNDAAAGIGVDSAGRVVVSGRTDSTDFPVANGFQSQLAGEVDGFVVRLSSTGNTLEYGTYVGGSGNDGATRLTLDPQDDIYLTGYTNSTDFPVSPDAMQTSFSGDYDAFAVRIAGVGGDKLFATYIGGRDGDSGSGIQVDGDGNVCVGGSTDSGDFPVGPVAVMGDFQGGRFGDAFITKLTSDGTGLVFSTYFGGSGSDSGADVALDREGYCYLVGTTDSNDLTLADPDILPLQAARAGGVSDIFVTKIMPEGDGIVFLTYLGSDGEDVARAIEVDEDPAPHTKAYILGETSSDGYPLLDPLQSNFGGNSDLFLTKLHAATYLVQPMIVLDYSTFLGGAGLDHAGDLAVDAIGNAAVTGDTTSGDFPQHQGPTAGKAKKKSSSAQGFVTKVFDGVPQPGGVLTTVRRINFGNVKAGRIRTKKLNIKNTSRDSRLAITVETPAAPLSLGKGVQGVFIKPGGQFTIDVNIAPGGAGITNTALVIRSSDPARPVVNIPVTAKTK